MSKDKAIVVVLVLTLVLGAGYLLSQRANREFFFRNLGPGLKVEDRADPENFLLRHQSQLAFPGNPSSSFIDDKIKEAMKETADIKFRGRPKGDSGQWFFLGPEEATLADEEVDWVIWPWASVQGRLTDLAISKKCKVGQCRLWVGSAAGGLWRTEQALASENALAWKRIGTGLGTSNIGSITIDPNDPSENTLYVGTGEHNFNYSSAAGRGLFKSVDGGNTFVKVPTMIVDPVVSADPIDFTETRGISQVAVHPGDADTIYVTTTTAMLGMTSVRGGQSTITGTPQGRPGLYRTADGGASWQLLHPVPVNTFSGSDTPDGIYEFTSGVKDVQLDPLDPNTVYISVLSDGLYRSSPALEGGDTGFKRVFPLQGPYLTSSNGAFALTVKNGHTRIYVYNGLDYVGSSGALYRVDDANVPAVQLAVGAALTPAWVKLSSPNILDTQAYISNNLCASQCTYDLFVESPEGFPDMVYLGGNYTKLTFNPVLRSTDAGVTFSAMGYDLQQPTGSTHVDVRAAVFHPGNPNIIFVAGDGGLTRTDGKFGDGSHLCQSYINAQGLGYSPGSVQNTVCEAELSLVPNRISYLNRGLVSMQFYNIAGDPRDPLGRLIAGAQDNSTQIFDGTGSLKSWRILFGLGDGTSASGFHPTDPNILFASYQSNWFFVNFRNGGKLPGNTVNGSGDPVSYSDLPATASWLLTSAPIILSGERDNPTATVSGRQFVTFDPVFPDTQFTGYESVWRTQDNGGDQGVLEANCSIWDVFYSGTGNFFLCGDWKALGTRLSDAGFGDRAGGTVVAAERSSGDSDTLWAGTSLGRVFITKNVNESDHTAVEFVRLDNSAGLPNRFVSGIAVDDSDPNVAYVSYSGFSEISAGAHVYRVTYDPNTMTALAVSLEHNLPDYPVNHIVRDDPTGDLYIASDFGVLLLRNGETSWEQAGVGLPVVLVPHLEVHPQHRKLLIGTHGLGAWYMNLGKINQ